MKQKFVIFLSLCAFVSALDDGNLQHHMTADSHGKFHVFWSVQNKYIIIELQVATKGYIEFGFSSGEDTLDGSDVIITWVLPNGKAFFQDRHFVKGHNEPLIDLQQNYQLLNAFENETHTVVRFTRKLDTCDKEEDIAITDNTMKIIFTWHANDPRSFSELPYIQPQTRSSKYIFFLSAPLPPVEITEDIITWDIQMPNVTLPAQQTTYWCKTVKIPQLDVPHHYIGYTMHVTPGNENVVHHFDLFQCPPNYSQYFEEKLENKDGWQCATSYIIADPLECEPAMIIWVVGSTGQTLPLDVGIPLGEEHGGTTYFQVQIHYNNLELKNDIIDSSILRLYLTKKPIKYTAAMTQMYENFDYTLLIPPKQPSFNITTYCPIECTSKAYPKEGIQVYAVGLHTHLAGRKITLKHFRGNKELNPISTDNNYQFNFQELRHLAEPVTVLPGDLLMGICEYYTMERNQTVLGGYGTNEEMCFFYIYYYPASPLSICMGGPSYQEIYDYFGVQQVAQDKIHIVAPASLANQTFFEHQKNYDWSKVDDTKLKQMQSMQFEGVKTFICQSHAKKNVLDDVIQVEYPANAVFYKTEQECY